MMRSVATAVVFPTGSGMFLSCPFETGRQQELIPQVRQGCKSGQVNQYVLYKQIHKAKIRKSEQISV